MLTIIIGTVIAVIGSLVVGVCAVAGLYIKACDEMTREDMGVRI